MKVSLFAALALALVAGCGEHLAAPKASDAGSHEAHAELDRMDTRVPVPLLPMMAEHQKQNMREHLLAVQEIAYAAAHDDYAAIEKSAARIGYSDDMARMCSHMGMGAPGFTDVALAFHRTADTIGDAARRKDKSAVLTALGDTIQRCTGCHAAFKQRIVDETEWTRITSSAPPSAPAGRGR